MSTLLSFRHLIRAHFSMFQFSCRCTRVLLLFGCPIRAHSCLRIHTIVKLQTCTNRHHQARSKTRAWGGQNRKMEFFSLPRAGGPNLEKVDKIYTRGEKFSKKVILTKILEFCRDGGAKAALAPPSLRAWSQGNTTKWLFKSRIPINDAGVRPTRPPRYGSVYVHRDTTLVDIVAHIMVSG